MTTAPFEVIFFFVLGSVQYSMKESKERRVRDALAASDCPLLIDCSLLRHLMCCYCGGISLRLPEVI